MSRLADLERGIAASARDLGFDSVEDCIDSLRSDEWTQQRVEVLARNLTVGETHFFREPDIFALLENEILPEIATRKGASDRRLRLWSAGCSSGEEAYSLAMVLARVLARLSGWTGTVLGTDINPLALRKAERGIYGEWSFRESPSWVRERYFRKTSDQRYEIASEIRQMVRFGYHNLVEDDYPALSTHTARLDVILCRNVLLYFSRERAEAVTAKFYRCLNDGGWLIGGTAEHFQAPGFSRVSREGRPLFKKAGHQVAKPAVRLVPPVEVIVPALATDAPPVVSPAKPAESGMIHEPLGLPADFARACANDGLMEEALRHCRAAIQMDKLNAEHYYLHAMILAETESPVEALDALRKALYLEPEFILAHFAMANLSRQLGDVNGGRKHLENTVSLLKKIEPESILPASEGITAGRFFEMVEALRVQTT